MQAKEYRIKDLRELKSVVVDIVAMLEKGEGEREDGAAVLALHGELGSGKTAFMQTLAKVLGIKETVTSPTYVVMKKYDTDHDAFKELVHIDAYRIEAVDEMRPLRFREELIQKGNIIGIEWAEKIDDLLPPHTLHVDLTIEGDERVIIIHGKENK